MDLISTDPGGDSIFIYDNLNPGDHFICYQETTNTMTMILFMAWNKYYIYSSHPPNQS
jgi:hypothetical protein